ncbi:hypothetical protein EYF80_038835 [Liparis tanakae]|uniref:Uncharacterized protein n=1 Tax=Liparis tanakae TaxID=230148 RepID=A0A4Z2GE60_9TELE|nr:hypothetical protein EYF80_038835 [Liparis tanakae]
MEGSRCRGGCIMDGDDPIGRVYGRERREEPTHLPSGPRTRVSRRRPRVKTGERLSRIGRGEAHAPSGGELLRSRVIVSRGGNGELRKQRPGAQQTDGKHRGTGSASAASEEQRQRGEKKGKS